MQKFFKKVSCFDGVSLGSFRFIRYCMGVKQSKGSKPEGAKNETYTVMIIGESGKYETVAKNVSGRLAGAIAKHYRANGVWVQTKEED